VQLFVRFLTQITVLYSGEERLADNLSKAHKYTNVFTSARRKMLKTNGKALGGAGHSNDRIQEGKMFSMSHVQTTGIECLFLTIFLS
jgi:hypothetical protein